MKKILIVVSIIFGMLVFRFSLDTFDTFLDANSINVGLSSNTNVTELLISGYDDESGRMIINDIINYVEMEDLDVIISVMKDNSEDFYRYLHLDMENIYIYL